MKLQNKMQNQKGQMVVEYVLLLVLSMGLVLLVSKLFQKSEFASMLITKPFEKVAGMVENGTWGTPEATRAAHPNQLARVLTWKPR